MSKRLHFADDFTVAMEANVLKHMLHNEKFESLKILCCTFVPKLNYIFVTIEVFRTKTIHRIDLRCYRYAMMSEGLLNLPLELHREWTLCIF